MEFANGVAKGLRTFAKLVGISAVVVAVASSLIASYWTIRYYFSWFISIRWNIIDSWRKV